MLRTVVTLWKRHREIEEVKLTRLLCSDFGILRNNLKFLPVLQDKWQCHFLSVYFDTNLIWYHIQNGKPNWHWESGWSQIHLLMSSLGYTIKCCILEKVCDYELNGYIIQGYLMWLYVSRYYYAKANYNMSVSLL